MFLRRNSGLRLLGVGFYRWLFKKKKDSETGVGGCISIGPPDESAVAFKRRRRNGSDLGRIFKGHGRFPLVAGLTNEKPNSYKGNHGGTNEACPIEPNLT